MLPPPVIQQGPEEIRKTYLSHEASIQSIGALYLLGAVFAVGSGFASIVHKESTTERVAVGVLLIALGVLQCWVGLRLRKLDPASKTSATILACLGLLAVPIGTIINGYVLYLIHSAKGKYVFSPDYRTVIEATPQIKYKTSIVVWIFLGILVVLLLVAILASAFSVK